MISSKILKCLHSTGSKRKKRKVVVNFMAFDTIQLATVEGKVCLQLMKEVCQLHKVPSRETINLRSISDRKLWEIFFKNIYKNRCQLLSHPCHLDRSCVEQIVFRHNWTPQSYIRCFWTHGKTYTNVHTRKFLHFCLNGIYS